MNKVIQIKCVAKCKMCKEEKGFLSAFEYSNEMFSMSRKSFYELADNDYEAFEQLVKSNCKFECERCCSKMNIVEILDMKYI